MDIHKYLLVALVVALSGVSGCTSLTGDDRETNYVALGASDASGIGAIPISRGYVFLVEKGLEARGLRVRLINLGIPGGKADDIHKAADIAGIGLQPDLVTIWTGANDLIDGGDPGEFERHLEGILERLRASSRGVVVIGDLPDLTRLPRFVDRPSPAVTAQRVAAFNSAIERQADRFDVSVARLSRLDMVDELTSDLDGFHPNNQGHRMIADEFLKVIIPALRLD
jgi:lysophospholipase L1-like esterase